MIAAPDEQINASLYIFPANYKASRMACSNKKPLYSTNHHIAEAGKTVDQ